MIKVFYLFLCSFLLFCTVFGSSIFSVRFEFSKILKLLSAKKSEESFFQATISEKIIEKFVPSGICCRGGAFRFWVFIFHRKV